MRPSSIHNACAAEALRSAGDGRGVAINHLQNAIDAASYMPHGYCLLWKPWLVSIHAGSDLLIFLAYTAIPIAILVFIRKRQIEFSGLAWLFIAFIFLCGVTHLVNVITLWFGIYETQGWIKLVTAMVSIATAVVIFPLLPKALAIPTPAEYEARLSEKLELSQQLRNERDNLEARVAERTRELDSANVELQHRCRNLLAVVSATARLERAPADFSERFGRKLAGLAASLDLLTEKNWGGTEIADLVEAQLSAFDNTLNIDVAGEPLTLKPSAVQHLGMALHELATNAAKHNPKGTQRLRWKVLSDEAGKQLVFTWSETRHEHGTVSQLPTSGSGRKLLERIVPFAFSGAGCLTITDATVEWILTAPLDGFGFVADAINISKNVKALTA